MLNDLDCSISCACMIHKKRVNLVLRARPGAVVYIGSGLGLQELLGLDLLLT